ncbi:MAG: DUF58 domain-containing protein [Planctomycetota bacterium]
MSDADPLQLSDPAAPRSLAFDAYAVAGRVAGLDLRARWLVNGVTVGLHRSIRKGFSTEFSDLREFLPGDDPARIDWRAYARRQRLMIKTYEAETNLRASIVVDVSASMQWTDPWAAQGPGWSKHEYAVTLAAALALIFARQNDALSVATFADGLRQLTPFRSSRSHLQQCWQMLSKEQPRGESQIERSLKSLAAINARSGMTLVIGDFLCPPAALDAGLQMLRAARQEIILFQILTPAERDGGGGRLSGRKLRDPETRLEATMPGESAAYIEKVRAHVAGIRAAAHKNGALYVFVPTETALENTLVRFFTSRRKHR